MPSVVNAEKFYNLNPLDTDEDLFEINQHRLFDYPKTGLHFKRRLWLDGDNIAPLPYSGTIYNSTSEIRQWMVYISHWIQDPPSSIVAYLVNDDPQLTTSHSVNLKVNVGHYDEVGNMVTSDQAFVENVVVHKGVTRVPISIHNYRGDIVHIKFNGVQKKTTIKAVELGKY